MKLAKRRLELAELEEAQDETNIDLQVARINAETEIADLKERIAGQESEQKTNINSLIKEQIDLEKALAEQKKKDAKEEEEEEEGIKNAKIKAAKDILKATTAIAGESSKVGKAAAVSNILIDTALAISGAVKAAQSMPFPGNLAAIATGIATVMANLRTAKGILSKAGAGDGGGDISVGAVGGTPAMGGIGGTIPNINSISPDAEMQPVQAFVIENEISDAQALQEELEIQATL
jgi:alanyl-tRNA synthetase